LRIGGFEKLSVFELAILEKKKILALSPEKSVKVSWVEILMITLVSSPKQHLRKDMQHSVQSHKPKTFR
jgi:hypothetical protein